VGQPGVLGTGVMLLVEGGGPGGGPWIQLHHMSFLLWAAVIVIHLGSYVPRLPRMLSGQPAERTRTVLAARTTRWLLLCGSLALGLVLAFATYHLSGEWGGSGSLIP